MMRHGDMEDEMRQHIDARAADLVRRGLPAAEAMRQARLEFGSMPRYIEEGREAWGLRLVDRTRSDLRVTIRSLWKSPVFALIAVATLALGIGANALVFSIVRGVLLKPLPYAGADRIYSIRTVVPHRVLEYPDLPVNGRHFPEWRKVCTSCESLALMVVRSFNLSGPGEPQRLQALAVSAGLLPLLGVRPRLGRGFTDGEDRPGADNVAILSDDLWRRSFGADPAVIGRKILLNQYAREIIGVLPADFRLPRGEQMGAALRMPDTVDVLVPLGTDLMRIRVGGNFYMGGLVKLRPGYSAAQAVAEMDRPLAGFAAEAQNQMLVRLLPLKDRMTADVRRPLWLLTGAAAALLLIVCVNIGNLLMARAAARQRDAAIRTAIGASRGDLLRYALTESMTLAFAAGAIGVALAGAGLRLLVSLAPSSLPRLEDVTLDWPVLLVCFGLASAAGAFCSLALGWRLWRANPHETLGTASQRTTELIGERRARQVLVGLETALSMALAAAAGLLAISFARIVAVDKGFETEHALTFQLALDARYPVEKRNQFHAEILGNLRAVPGVVAAGLTTFLPLEGEMWIAQLRRQGDTRHVNNIPLANWRFVSPGYFRAAGTPLSAGRVFEESDHERKVVIISERTAKRVFAGENPLGQVIHYSDDRGQYLLEIIGVARDVRTATRLEVDPPLMVYLPYWHTAQSAVAYVVRAAGDEKSLISGVRAAVASIDRELPLHRVRTMTQLVESSVAPRRLQVLLAGGFALSGVLLACLGVFGVVSYGVSRRTNELGVRMALGATRSGVVALVLRDSIRPVLIGLAAGLACVLAFGRLLASQLYGVNPRDPWILAAIAASIALAALGAAYWPAHRASTIDPVRALRWE